VKMSNGSEPLWMPPGSVRAIIALMFSVAVIVAVGANADSNILDTLIPLATFVLGQYFGTRSNFTK